MNRSKSRLRKTECSACGAILYGSIAALRASKGSVCGCGGTFEIAHPADLEQVDPDAFHAMIDSLPDKARNAVMKELGYTDAVHRSAGTIAAMKKAEMHRKARARAMSVDIPF